MNNEKKYQWLERRLAELGKRNYELADYLGLQHNKISQIKAGAYNFQLEHLSSVAEFLKFDKAAFLDFIAGKITEDQLWNTKPPIKISDTDLALLNAVKSIATQAPDAKESQVNANTTAISSKDKEKGR